MNDTEMGTRKRSLWELMLGLLEEEVAQRRDRKVFIEVHSASGTYPKEIAELSAEERRSLNQESRERVAEWLVDRYLAKQDCIDLLEGRRAYTKNIRDLTPEDLPAVIEAERYRAEELREERECEEFARDRLLQ
jgi:hypothetical protein